MKNPLTTAGIEPATFRFLAQHLNHRDTAVPTFSCMYSKYEGLRGFCTCKDEIVPKSAVPQILNSNPTTRRQWSLSTLWKRMGSEDRSTAPLIPNLDTRRKWVVYFTLRPIRPGEIIPILPSGSRVGTQIMSEPLRKREISASALIRTLNCPTRSLYGLYYPRAYPAVKPWINYSKFQVTKFSHILFYTSNDCGDVW